jgi:hypothetical protein
VSAHELCVLHSPALVHRDLDFYDSGDVHAARQLRIRWGHFALEFACDLILILPLCWDSQSGASTKHQQTHRKPMS